MFKTRENIVLLLLVMISPAGLCQQNFRMRSTGGNDLATLYLEKTGSAREYIDGRDYFPYYYRSKTTPILRPGEERSASLTIHGRSYKGLALHYDTYTDEVIYTDDSLIYNNRVRQVSLNKCHVSRFDLCFRHDTLHFRYFPAESDTSFNLPEGFYEVVYEMKTRLLVRHVSSVHISPEKIADYIYRPVNYIQVGNSYAEVRSKKEFVSLFGDRAEEISRFIRQKHIRINRAEKKQIAEVLKYYETLPAGAV